MLNKQKMISGFQQSVKQANQASKSAEQSIKSLKSGIGQSMTHKQFQEQAKKISENAMGNIQKQTIENYAQAIADYLNGMTDPTGDGPLKPFTKSQTKPIVEALKQPSPKAVAVPPVDARVKAAWAALFPIQFKLSTPPPGSVQKVSSIGAPSVIGTMAPVITGEKKHKEMMKKLATVIDTAARQIVVTVQHTIPSPSGPVPGPPIVSPVK